MIATVQIKIHGCSFDEADRIYNLHQEILMGMEKLLQDAGLGELKVTVPPIEIFFGRN